MANELRIAAQLEYSKSGVKQNKHDSTYADVSGDSFTHVVQEVGTSDELIVIGSDVATWGYVYLKNLTSSYSIKLKPGEVALFRAAAALYAKAESGSSGSDLEVMVIED
jgi:hypothetical protein